MHNHYFDNTHPLHPYTHSAYATPGTVAPVNALRDNPPHSKEKHPAEKNGEWVEIEDHRGKEGYINGVSQVVSDYGPLPDGWSDTPPPPALADVQATKRAEITVGFTAAMSASLAMPSASEPPSAYEVATALYDWRTDDPECYTDLLAIHEARRDALLAAVAAADTANVVLAIVVSYAV